MKAIEVKATVDELGQLSLDKPLRLRKFSRVRVIVLIQEKYVEDCVEDGELYEPASESFRQGWYDAITGNTVPVSQLWEGIYEG